MHPRVAGKFIEIGGTRFLIKGVSYGTFAPSDTDGQFPRLDQVRADFAMMAEWGFNTVRTYTVPSLALLDEAERHGLRVIVGVPWMQHVAFLGDARLTRRIRREIAAHVKTLGAHPAALLFSVGNEIPQSVVRWHGPSQVTRFLRDVCAEAKASSPQSLLAYVNYPPTEYLDLDVFDICAFNVYLHREADLRAYLARLQQIAGARPLLLAEAGADSLREGPHGQAAVTAMHVRAAFEEGLCGAVAFSWTDDWWRGGSQIEDWAFGLVDAARRPKAALAPVSAAFAGAPFGDARRREWPRVSVVVCAYNAADTLDDCLASLGRLDYPDYEVLVVNDGSRDATSDIARRYPVRVIDIPNGGLSAARNLGLSEATGEIVAYTDADVRVDPDWLAYLVQPFLTSDVVGSGGPNVVPADDPAIAQCVARAPGGPTHVMLDDRIAEHVPGCNMAFRRDALLAIGGFNPVYLRAGDDVDICWRLQARGGRIGFAPAALVWHHHRASVKAYWRQQVGYGEGETWLEAHHPEKFVRGTMLWHGRIYSPLPFIRALSKQRVNSGTWGTAAFPSVYAADVHPAQLLPHAPAWQALSTLALVLGLAAAATGHVGFAAALLLTGGLGWTTTIARCLMFGWRSDLRGLATARGVPRRLMHRLLIAWLHFLQPLARVAGRVRGRWSPPPVIEPARATRLTWRVPSPEGGDLLASARLLVGGATEERFWSESWTSNDALLTETAGLLRAARPARVVDVDDGWQAHRDVSVGVGRWGWLDVRALIEEHGGSRCLLRVGLRLRPALGGVLLALGLIVLAIATTRAAVGLRWPWLGVPCVLGMTLVFAGAAWQTGAAVALARRAVQRAASTVGMTPIPLHPRTNPWWRFNPRVAVPSQRVQGLVLVLLVTGAADAAVALLRHAGPRSVGVRVSDIEAGETSGDTTAGGVSVPGLPGDVAVAADGGLFLADPHRGVIHRFDVEALNEPARASALLAGSDDRQLLSAERRIDAPTSIDVDLHGDLYVADARSHRVSRISRDSGEVVVIAGSGRPGYDGDLKPAVAARLHSPSGVAVAPNGDVYIADTGNNRIRVVSALTGLVHTIAGPGAAPRSAGLLGDGAPAEQARLDTPMAVAIGPDGDVYIADTGHHRVRVVRGRSGLIDTVAGDGRPRSEGDGGPAREAGLAGPTGLALSWSKQGVTLYVAEFLGGSVRAVGPGGDISTVGQPRRFAAPSRVAYRRGGWLYVVDGDGAVTALKVPPPARRPLQVATVLTNGARDERMLSLIRRVVR